MRFPFLPLILILALLAPAAAHAQVGLDKLVSFNTRDSEIRDIVMTIGKLAGVNVMVDPKIRGKMPLQLKDVTAVDALKLVAGITGNKVGMVEGVVIFATEDTLKFMAGPARNAIFQLKYAKSEDVATIINKVFMKDLQSIHHGPTNKLIVTPK